MIDSVTFEIYIHATKLKMQLLYYGIELPQNLTSLSRMKWAQYKELWLSEISYLVDPQSIIKMAVIWLQNTV